MTEKIADEVDAKIHFGKMCKNQQKQFFLMVFVTPSKNVGPNLKLYSERFLSQFYGYDKKTYLPRQITE